MPHRDDSSLWNRRDDAHMLDCWLVESPSTVFCRFGGWSLGRFVCCHLAVTWSHCEGISMDKCHGSWSHSKRCETCNGSHGQTKRPRRNDASGTCHGAHCNKCDGHPQRNPLQSRIALHNDESLSFIMIDRHDSSLPINCPSGLHVITHLPIPCMLGCTNVGLLTCWISEYCVL